MTASYSALCQLVTLFLLLSQVTFLAFCGINFLSAGSYIITHRGTPAPASILTILFATLLGFSFTNSNIHDELPELIHVMIASCHI